ncbi:GNAT family N-acetyltransferase [Pseudoalteromonas phenolica]|uniref:GCN5-related N-acetyltransferase n=1 Tax=Pseudoalteromonas phenolica TaxID=161398 RepID=A0A0S2K3A2_9GAMM|nr:GNAT family N-acetyltransferase [Pseudoalteromonas phenolica]ALO42697.1 GCN5-related N-acetyltransferase [Pseudoalteromonas phenolica]MBE0356196.1 hypothetical protein [Pseudoalteromonas phenolica O-BC30]RXF06360.1 N-acetyltransferase [Pseudoalteromonas phenolica O-BC30]
MNKAIFRLAVIDDAEEINSVSIHLGYQRLSGNQASEKLQSLLESEADQIFVAELKGKIIGWIHLFYARRLASNDFYEIGGLVVNPEYRGLGIGKSLVKFATSQVTEEVRVRCNETRLESHLFYEQQGFKSIKSQRVFKL